MKNTIHIPHYLLPCLLLLALADLNGQLNKLTLSAICGNSVSEKQHKSVVLNYSQNEFLIEQEWRNLQNSRSHIARFDPQTIPVVFHIIQDPDLPSSSNYYPKDIEIHTTLEWINNILAGNSACNGDQEFNETGIRLCLASRDIYGSPSDGIFRYPHKLTDLDLCKDELNLKSIPREVIDLYPNTDYLNVYIVREICASCEPFDCLAGGFAAYPPAHGTTYDGIVFEASIWIHPDCHYRKTILHEFGHFLNLRHTWEGGCLNDNCLEDGDKVCDTPPDNDQDFFSSNPCYSQLGSNSCSTDVNITDPNNPFSIDQQDPSDNFMDYAPTQCLQKFTPDQILRMKEALNGPRASLLSSKGCLLPCPTPINFNIIWPTTPFVFGQEIIIQNFSTGGSDYNWTWFDDQSNSTNLQIPADSIGTFLICLSATNGDPSCAATQCGLIEVLCPAPIPNFTISTDQAKVGSEVSFTQTSPIEPGVVYSWYVNGLFVGQGSPYNYIVNNGGSFSVWLEACSDGCCTRSTSSYFQSGSCPTGKEANHWLFGRDSIHLNWNSGNPVEQPASSCSSDEAMAVAISEHGELLFYSNAERVFNRNNQLMANGFLDNSNRSSTHTLTIPLPGSDSLWYLFYMDQYDSANPDRDTTTKLYMAIVDMSLDNGWGDVIMKNQVLLQPTTEKVAAIRHCNNIDWWIIGHEAGTNRFFAWQLTSLGILPPVVSSQGVVKSKYMGTKAGEMNISNKGSRIAMSTGPDISFETIPHTTIELFDFDPSTGIITNAMLIGEYPLDNGKSAYGLEFSSSSEILYVAYQASIDTLIQYDLSSGIESSIINSRQNIYISPFALENQFGAMLTGPDKKIYIANFSRNYFSSIANSDVLGAGCNFTSQAVLFSRGESFVGLPTFPADVYTPNQPWLIGPTTVCDSISAIKFFVSNNCRVQEYNWSIIGGSEAIRQEGDTVWVRPGDPGIDQLVVTKFTACSTLYDTIKFEILSCSPPPPSCNIPFEWIEADSTICIGEDAWLRFNTAAELITFTLLPGGQTQNFDGTTFNLSGLTSDQIIQFNLRHESCDTQFTVNIKVNPSLNASIIYQDSVVCQNEVAFIEIQSNPSFSVEIFPKDFSYIFVDPPMPFSFGPLINDTTIYIRIRDILNGCENILQWSIKVESEIRIGNDSLEFCAGDSLLIGNFWIKKDTIIANSFIRQGCDSLQYTQYQIKEPLKAELEIKNPCGGLNGQIVILTQNGSVPFEYSLNGIVQADGKFENLGPGDYHLVITDALGCRLDTSINLIEENGIPGLEIEVKNATCDLSNGSIVLYPNSDEIQFAFVGSAFTYDSVFFNLDSGIYRIAAINSFGCTDTFNFTINQEGGPIIESFTITEEHCNSSDGNIIIREYYGGLSPYLFQLDNEPAQSNPLFENLKAGLYKLLLTDSNGCIDSVDVLVSSKPSPWIQDLIINPALCNQPVGEIEIIASEMDSILFKIDDAIPSGNNLFQGLISGSYDLEIIDSFGCKDSVKVFVPDTFMFVVKSIEIGSSFCSEKNGIIEFTTTGSTIEIYIEELQKVFFNSTIENLGPGDYHIQITDSFHCSIDTIIKIPFVCEINLPNIFSPNNDGINEVFGIINNLVDIWELSIFDRSGNMVFYSQDPQVGWNGDFRSRKVQPGVYAWVLTYKLNDSFPNQTEARHLKGDVTLIR